LCFRRCTKQNIKPAIAIKAAPPTPTPTPIGTAELLLFSGDGVLVGAVPVPVSPAPVPVPVPFPAVVDAALVGVEELDVVFELVVDVTPGSIVATTVPARAETTWLGSVQLHPE
jgi:hypothetical protein